MREFMELQEAIGEREKALRELASNAKGIVLDVATGSGYLARHLRGQATKVVCVDLEASALRRTRNEFVDWRMEFVCCDARNLPFRDQAFDSVITWAALVHVSEWKIAVKEMFRVSRRTVATCEPKGEYSVRAWRDFKCRHDPPIPEEVSQAFSNYGKVERLGNGFIEEIRCVRHL